MINSTKPSIREIFFHKIVPILFLISAFLCVILPLFIGQPNEIEESYYTENGKNVVGYNLFDIGNSNTFLYVNHFPEKYTMPGEVEDGAIIEKTDSLTLAPYGTLQLVVFNYNYKDEENKNLENTEYYNSQTDSSLISLYLPFPFDNAVMWVDDVYYTTNGKMADYSLEDYNKFDDPIAIDYQNREPSKVDLILPIHNIPTDKLEAATILTIHYQAKRGVNYANNLPYIGLNQKVTANIITKYTSIQTTLAVLVSILIATLGILLLKASYNHIIELLMASNGLLLMVAQFISVRFNLITAKYIVLIALSFLLTDAIYLAKPKIKKLYPLWYTGLILALINVVIELIIPAILPFKTVILYTIIAFILLFLIGSICTWSKFKYLNMMEIVALFISFTTPIISITLHYSMLRLPHPSAMLTSMIGFLLVWYILDDMSQLEKENTKLTKNLQVEVKTQTRELQQALDDRELLLTFVSHDLRKVALQVTNYCDEIVDCKDAKHCNEQTAKIKEKASIVLDSLTNISTYVKHDYTVEDFATVKIDDLFNEIAQSLTLDCEANGIRLACVPNNASIRCRKLGLISIINNLIFNAIEHAHCENIVLSATKTKDTIDIYVHDDGVGIEDDKNIFSPLVTTQDTSSNSGLGLFLVKSEIENQNGSIRYERNLGSNFILSLPRQQ